MTGNDSKNRAESDMHRQKRGKNIAVALCIFAFCVVVYLVSIIKMGGGAG